MLWIPPKKKSMWKQTLSTAQSWSPAAREVLGTQDVTCKVKQCLYLCPNCSKFKENIAKGEYQLPQRDWDLVWMTAFLLWFRQWLLNSGNRSLRSPQVCVWRRTFQCSVMPLGLHNSPCTLQKVKGFQFSRFAEDHMFSYLHNLTVLKRASQEHLNCLKVFIWLQEDGLKLKHPNITH